jgi:hypothetical protein
MNKNPAFSDPKPDLHTFEQPPEFKQFKPTCLSMASTTLKLAASAMTTINTRYRSDRDWFTYQENF